MGPVDCLVPCHLYGVLGGRKIGRSLQVELWESATRVERAIIVESSRVVERTKLLVSASI